MTILAEILDRWPRLLPGTADTGRWAETIGWGQATPRRPGEPRGRDTAPPLTRGSCADCPDRARCASLRRLCDGPPAVWDYELGGPGQLCRTALRRSVGELRSADAHLCNAYNRCGTDQPWVPARRGPTDLVELLRFCPRPDGEGLLLRSVRLAARATLAHPELCRKTDRDLAAADRCVIRAHSVLGAALEIVHRDDRPSVQAPCANPNCRGLARPGRKICNACRVWSSRHKGEPLSNRQCGVGPSDAEQGRQAQAKRMARGEGFGTGVLPRPGGCACTDRLFPCPAPAEPGADSGLCAWCQTECAQKTTGTPARGVMVAI